MPDVTLQLHAYFEDVVERVTDEDVRIRAETARGVRIPDVRLRLRPLAAGAIGFGLASTLLGAVLVTHRLFGATTSDSTDGGPAILSDPSPGASAVMIISLVVGLGLLVLGMTFMRSTRLPIQGGEEMQTMEQVDHGAMPVGQETERLRTRYRMFAWLSGVLAIAVLALGAWLMVELSSSDGADLPSEVQATLDGYLDGWNAHSGPDVMDHVTDGYTFDNGPQVMSRLATAQMITGLASDDFRVEVLDSIATGDGPYYVTSTERVLFDIYPEGLDGVSVYTIVNDGGAWKVQNQKWIGDEAS